MRFGHCVRVNAHAASRPEVVVDMGKVMRIDFPFTGAFFDAIGDRLERLDPRGARDIRQDRAIGEIGG